MLDEGGTVDKLHQTAVWREGVPPYEAFHMRSAVEFYGIQLVFRKSGTFEASVDARLGEISCRIQLKSFNLLFEIMPLLKRGCNW